MASRRRRPIALLLGFLIAFPAAIALDRLAGLLLPPRIEILFPAGARVVYETPEFRFVVRTNSIGLRDTEIPLRRTGRKRVLAIGDSFTFGWGVRLEETWPKVLEAALRRSGEEVEILKRQLQE